MRRYIWMLFFAMYTCLTHASPVVSYQLPNGLKLFVQEDHRAPVVVSQVWYKVGSSYETVGTTGISHALEHMMFKGTPKYGPGRFSEIVAENGGQNNAFTDRDYTAYYEVLSADKLPIAFELEADRMRHLNLDAKEFSKEIQVVMEERRMRTDDNPQMLTYERFVAAAHIANAYHHLPIGWMDDLKHMTIDDLRHWYQTWYAPNNALLVVVGDVQPEKVHQLALKYFGSLPSSELPPIKSQREVPSLGMRSVSVKAPAEVPWLVMGYNVPSLKTAEDSNVPYVLAVIAALLDGGNSARLPRILVRDQQIAADVSADYNPYDRLDTLFSFDGTPAQGHDVAQLKAALLAQIDQLKTGAVSDSELARVKAGVIASKVYAKDSIEAQASEIGSLEAVGLSWQLRDEFVKRISAVTPQQIQAVAKQYFTLDNATFTELHPLPLTEAAKKALSHAPTGDTHVQ